MLVLTLVVGACTKDNDLKVSISNDIDKYSFVMSSVRGITLTPVIEGSITKKVIYHWTTDDDTQQFQSLDGEKIIFTNEMTNDGDPVLFTGGPGSINSNGDYLTTPVHITLTIREENTDNVVATAELTITREKGFYIVKNSTL